MTIVRTLARSFAYAACVAAALDALAADTSSQVFRCLDRQGQIVFSGTSCGSNAEKVDVVDSSSGLTPIAGDGLSEQERAVLNRRLVKKEPDPSRIPPLPHASTRPIPSQQSSARTVRDAD